LDDAPAPTAAPKVSRTGFYLRRLHSLSGVLPVGVFLVEHLWTNATVLGGQRPFDEAVARGVSANLCDAVARLAEAARGIEIGLTWARSRPAGRRHETFRFSPEVGEVLSEAARIFRQSEPLTDTRVTGFVIALDRPIEQFDGNATLRTLIDEKPRRVTVRFEHALYPLVIRAFEDKSAISLLGDLFPGRQRWELRNPREIRLLEDQEGDDVDP